MSEREGVACDHWTDIGSNAGGSCGLGLHGGTPSHGTCARCEHYEGKARGLGDVVHRMVGRIVKANGCGGCAKRRRILNERFPLKG